MPLSIQLILLSLICTTAFNCLLHGRVKARQLKPGVIKRRVFFVCLILPNKIIYLHQNSAYYILHGFLLVSFFKFVSMVWLDWLILSKLYK